MNSVGVIVEYNPFHYGHVYHIDKARERTGADVVIAAMSGNFLQRGEPALVSKWFRAEMALRGGVDIVFELPYAFAVQKADTFAKGSVSLLAAAGCSTICFGSESGDINQFYDTYQFLNNHTDQYDEAIRYFMNQGNSYPKSLSLAFDSLNHSENVIDLSKPNNILGFQYVKAAKEQQLSINLDTVQRQSAGYHDEHFSSSSIASATSIRKAIFSNYNGISEVETYVPKPTYQLLVNYQKQFGNFHSWDRYWQYLKFLLIGTKPEDLKGIYEVEEGLENRFKKKVMISDSFPHFMNEIKTKRYTWTRLQRTLTHILTNTKKEDIFQTVDKVNYLRLLGMTEKGRNYLNRYKKDFSIPILTKISSHEDPLLKMDIKAAQLYAMGLSDKNRHMAIQLEYTQKPIYIH